MSGKGSARRPLSVDEQTFNDNFDAIFGKKKLNIVDKKEEEWDESNNFLDEKKFDINVTNNTD